MCHDKKSDAKCPDVSEKWVCGHSLEHFGGHVRPTAYHCACFHVRCDVLGETKVGKLKTTVFVDENVGRFDIAMGDVLTVAEEESGGDLEGVVDEF